MNVLVTGGCGQLGRALVRRADTHGHAVTAVDIDKLDICDPAQVDAYVTRSEAVINAAAYTAVDKAEAEPERAFAVNRDGAGVLARACAEHRRRLLHVSTDYVFDGAGTRPYREDDPIAPIGVYGASKAAGDALVHAAGGTVVRTSWLFGQGGPSFVHTIVRLAKERPALRVVADQHGRPTWTDHLADALYRLLAVRDLAPTYHYASEGATTWHGFATAIVEVARTKIALACERIDAITTAGYPTAARRPAYSILDTERIAGLGIAMPPWRLGLEELIAR